MQNGSENDLPHLRGCALSHVHHFGQDADRELACVACRGDQPDGAANAGAVLIAQAQREQCGAACFGGALAALCANVKRL